MDAKTRGQPDEGGFLTTGRTPPSRMPFDRQPNMVIT